MRLKTLIIKDLKVNFRRKMTLLLILLLPLSILFSAGLLFSNSQPPVKVPMCSRYNATFTNQMMDKLSKISDDNIYRGDCKELEEKLSVGQIAAYFELPKIEDFSLLKRSPSIKMHVDSTNVFRKKLYVSYAQVMIKYYAIEFGTEYISSLWNKLKKVNLVLKGINAQLTKISMPFLNPNKFTINESLINQQIKVLNNTKNAINYQSAEFYNYSNNIDDEIYKINDTYEQIDPTITELNSFIDVLDGIKINSNYAIAKLDCNSNMLNQGCMQLMDINSNIDNDKAKLYSVIDQMKQAKGELNNTKNKLYLVKNKLNESKGDINYTKEKIDKMIYFLKLLKEKNVEAKDAITKLNNASSDMSSFSDKLRKSNDLIIKVVNKIASQKTQNIINPLSLRVIENRKVSLFESFIPGIIVILIYFLSILLGSMNIVNEERNGTLLNALLMKVKISEIILSKIIAITLIIFIQILFILGVANIFYGIHFTFMQIISLLFYSTILIILFLSISTLVAAIGKEEFTVIMVSLLFIIPSMFTQGLFVPEQLMNPAIVPIMKLTPSYLASQIITTNFFHNVGFVQLLKPISVLLIYALISLAIGVYVMINRIKDTDI